MPVILVIFPLRLSPSNDTGIGLGLVYSPSVVMIGQYFDKHFTVANGIAYAGGAMGQIFLPLLSGSLIDVFGWRGTVWLLSAIMCNLVAAGAALRPKIKRENRKRTRKDNQEKCSDSHAHDNKGFEDSNRTSSITTEVQGVNTMTEIDSLSRSDQHIKRNKTASPNSSHHPNVYTNMAFQGDSDVELLSVKKIADTAFQSYQGSSPSTNASTQNDEMRVSKRQERHDLATGNINMDADGSSSTSRFESSNFSQEERSSKDSDNMNETKPPWSSSTGNIDDVEMNMDRDHNVSDTTKDRNTCMSIVKILISNVCFDLILIVFFIMGFIFFTPVAHAIPRAVASGIDESKASLLPTIFGVGSLVGRLGPSFATDCLQIPRDVINISGFVLCTIGNILNPFFRRYWYHVVYHLMYGGATGCLTVFTFTLIQIVLQKEHRVYGIGLATLFLCIGDTAGSLLAGQ